MPRPSKPWFRAASGTWVSRVNGRLCTLARGKGGAAKARQELARLLGDAGHLGTHEAAEEAIAGLTVARLADLYLASVKGRLATSTVERQRNDIRHFTRHCGHLQASEIRPRHLDYIHASAWSSNTRRHALATCRRLTRWALLEGLLSADPLAGVTLPGPQRRGRIPSAEEVRRLLEVAPPAVRDLAECLALTGARPGELMAARVADVDVEHGWILLERHKTAGRTGRPRIVYLPARALAIVKRRCKGRGPAAWVFADSKGGQWTAKNYTRAFIRLRSRHDLPSHLVPYSLRHFRATEWLRLGVPIAHVAELLGHTSTAMVSRVYSHLSQHSAELRRSANVA